MTRQYKDSGIEWIGQIPMDWKMQPLAIYFAENSKSNSDLGSVNALQFKYGEIIQKPNNGKELTDKDRELLEKYTVVSPDDIVVNGLNLNYDLKSLRIAKVREDGIITSAYIVLRPRNGANASFYNYYLKALDFEKIFHGMGVGIRLTLSYNELRSMLLAVPSFEEQQRIANYLDKKCAEIDGLIELQEQMIAQLTDYKQSVITEAVTKGLNPNVEFVPSGVDWIGDVPKGWRIAQTRRIVRNHLQGYYDADGYVTSGYRLLRITDLLSNGNLSLENAPFVKETPNIKDFILQPGDFCFARTGGAGNFGFVSGDIEPAVFASYLIRFRFSGQNNNYLRYYFLSYSFISEVNSLIHGGVNKNIHAENIKDTHLPLPPLSEQKSIADYLDKECKEIDDLIAIKQQKIETLKEYKKSVIFEAVTGKIEIS